MDVIGGFPFMLQLLGYRTWNMAFEHDTLTVDDVRRGALVAQSELASRVFDATVRELSLAIKMDERRLRRPPLAD